MRKLTPREVVILTHMSRGLSAKQIAFLLNVKLNTINAHRDNIHQKLGVNNRVDAVMVAINLGYIVSPVSESFLHESCTPK